MHGRFKTLALAGALLASVALLASDAGAQNIAQGKNAFQSSDYDPGRYAGRAVDGNTQGNFTAPATIANTAYDFNAWWYVDLAGTYGINSITLWNRTDCCGSRLSDFFVSVLAAGTPNVGDINAPTVWSQLFSGAAGVSEVFLPSGAQGQYVKVQFNNHAEYLQLAEVEVTATAVVSATPEPASLVLLGTGLLAVGGVAARRKKTA